MTDKELDAQARRIAREMDQLGLWEPDTFITEFARRLRAEWIAQQEPCATLHADGYWTWKGVEPYESTFAGWRMEVYAAPSPSPSRRTA